ncbi:MAG: DEAD/DEAH box helicase [Candidatus Accumulibacter sp.]|nr:DEAD/DEAH box helicase [Accumulibacter sp.]
MALDDSHPVPGLRLAWVLDRQAEEAKDPILAGHSWATTIVRAEIRKTDIIPHLQEEIRQFPAPFLLFLPVAVSLDLDAGDGARRQLRRKLDGPDLRLFDGDDESRWRFVENAEVRINDAAAKADATNLHAREVVPLAWAMPLDAKRESAGRFWAFFPTDTATRLPGILNAPWKVNNDRTALIKGEWNNALMREAAGLIARTLSELATEADPGRPLDAFPRQLELKDELAAPLVEALWARILAAVIIPDAQGTPRPSGALKRPPLDDADLQRQWNELAPVEARVRWVHPTCLTGDRPKRLEALVERLRKGLFSFANSSQDDFRRFCEAKKQGLSRASASDWFAEIATINPASAKRVLAFAKHYAKQQPVPWSSERPCLRIIPADSGRLCCATEIVLAPEGIPIPPGRECVARALASDTETLRLLTEVLGVKRLDDEGWRELLGQDLASAMKERPFGPRKNDKEWRMFWEILRHAPCVVRKVFVEQHCGQIRVLRRDGAWVLYDEALLPGGIVGVDDPDKSNLDVLVDADAHAVDQDLLAAIGVGKFPVGEVGPDHYRNVVGDEHLERLIKWLGAVDYYYRVKLDTNSNPQSGNLRPFSLVMPHGWMLLAQLQGQPNARLTKQFLGTLGSLAEQVGFGHITRPKLYPQIQVTHPLLWFIRQHGTFAIGQHSILLATLLARREIDVLSRMAGWSQIKGPLARLVDLVGAPALTQPSRAHIGALWQALFEHLGTPDAIAADGLHGLWTAAAADGQVPETVQTHRGAVPLSSIYVSGLANLTQRARAQGKTAITLEAVTLKLWLDKGARNLDALFHAQWSEVLASPALLEAIVPELAEVLRCEARTGALVLTVRGLRLEIEGQGQPIPCLLWEGVLHLDPAQMEALSRVKRLAAILQEADAAGWLNQPIAEARRIIGDAQLQANREGVAAGASLADRLLRAVGGKTQTLIQVLGETVDKALPSDCSSLGIAELVLAMRGPTILQDIRSTLEAEGLCPPSRWGGDEARAFVAAIGFPDAFAAAPETRREAQESISGPIRLPPLHDFQDEVFTGLRELIESRNRRRRAVVSLPTGGGKTRVTVQAAVDLVLKPESGKRSVLWVAQTDELCEQAVQSFRQVWVNRGAERTDLRIIRFWGGHRNPSPSTVGRPTVVIASIQTLNSRIGRDELDWLSHPGLVVVDECHHALTPSYTGLLKWLDAESPRSGATAKDEPPIIGLSATPFRGANDDEENLRLAKRFDQRWLPADQQSLHENLTSQGILAVAEHEPLPSPSLLPPALIERMGAQSDSEGIQFENLLEELNRWLADDEDRNRLLIDTIAQCRQESILFFTNSVQHAEEMAVRLNIKGIPAHAVSGDTPASARRYFLERFQSGQARILCNHSVLTTGFDAPRTDMVLIARQVMSPVRYMQMVGRGLRGVKNGGTARCRIVTVLDNLGRFSGKHPYHFCAKFFPLKEV